MTQGPAIEAQPSRDKEATERGSVSAQDAATVVCDLLSIDVEDYFHVEAFAGTVSRSEWPGFQSRVRRNTERILELLAEYKVPATFFVLGWVAEREPALVRAIAEAGHELACHSHLHRRVFTLAPEEFREDLCRAKGAIEHAGGMPVYGFRAPTFSIGRNSLWALQVLAEEGFLYDSSIFPIRHDLYGMPEAPRFTWEHALPDGGSIVEVPPSTVRLFRTNLGVAGGGYLRHLPMWYTHYGMRRIHQERQPANVYFHPWELDPDQPRIGASWKSSLRHYRGLEKMEPRLRRLLARNRFGRMIDHVREWRQREAQQARTR
ncbi:MAG TPA: XrtA system polysaccharide deacetylase [Candidatus Angelobacter sp.]